MPTEKFANSATTTLGSSMTNIATTMTVTTNYGFPLTPNFRVKIDSEIIMVTDNVLTSTWTITRGVDGTIAAAHSNGAVVSQVLTVDGINHISGYVELDLDSQLPIAERDGRLFLSNNSPRMYRDAGNSWNAWHLDMPIKVPPLISTFTAINFGASTAVDSASGIYVKIPIAAGENIRNWVVARPNSVYTLTIGWHHVLSWGNYSYVGVATYNSSNTRTEPLVMFNLQNVNGIGTRRMTNPTTYNSDVAGARGTISDVNPIFFRVRNNGSGSKTYSLSHDGVNFEQVSVVTEASFIVETHVGFCMGTINSPTSAPSGTIFHWELLNS